jgi:glycosyltransferase involved in cell wall biosynthesis
MNDACELSVVIPAYNEADHLMASVSHVIECVRPLEVNYEIVLVDDGSRDETWQRVRALRNQHHSVRGIRLSRNFGKDSAIAAGLAASRGAAAMVLDADLQHPPELIPKFYSLWKSQNYEIVEGMKSRQRAEGAFRRLASDVFNRLASRYTGIPFASSCDFKLLSRRAIDHWLQFPEKRVFFRGMVTWMGFRKAQVVFDVPARAGGGSKWSTLSLLRLALHAVISFSSAPLRIAHVVSAAFVLFGIALGARALQLKFTGQAVGGFTTVIILILVATGLILGVLGIMCEYLGAIYEEVKDRPRYIVSDITD